MKLWLSLNLVVILLCLQLSHCFEDIPFPSGYNDKIGDDRQSGTMEELDGEYEENTENNNEEDEVISRSDEKYIKERNVKERQKQKQISEEIKIPDIKKKRSKETKERDDQGNTKDKMWRYYEKGRYSTTMRTTRTTTRKPTTRTTKKLAVKERDTVPKKTKKKISKEKEEVLETDESDEDMNRISKKTDEIKRKDRHDRKLMDQLKKTRKSEDSASSAEKNFYENQKEGKTYEDFTKEWKKTKTRRKDEEEEENDYGYSEEESGEDKIKELEIKQIKERIEEQKENKRKDNDDEEEEEDYDARYKGKQEKHIKKMDKVKEGKRQRSEEEAEGYYEDDDDLPYDDNYGLSESKMDKKEIKRQKYKKEESDEGDRRRYEKNIKKLKKERDNIGKKDTNKLYEQYKKNKADKEDEEKTEKEMKLEEVNDMYEDMKQKLDKKKHTGDESDYSESTRKEDKHVKQKRLKPIKIPVLKPTSAVKHEQELDEGYVEPKTIELNLGYGKTKRNKYEHKFRKFSTRELKGRLRQAAKLGQCKGDPPYDASAALAKVKFKEIFRIQDIDDTDLFRNVTYQPTVSREFEIKLLEKNYRLKYGKQQGTNEMQKEIQTVLHYMGNNSEAFSENTVNRIQDEEFENLLACCDTDELSEIMQEVKSNEPQKIRYLKLKGRLPLTTSEEVDQLEKQAEMKEKEKRQRFRNKLRQKMLMEKAEQMELNEYTLHPGEGDDGVAEYIANTKEETALVKEVSNTEESEEEQMKAETPDKIIKGKQTATENTAAPTIFPHGRFINTEEIEFMKRENAYYERMNRLGVKITRLFDPVNTLSSDEWRQLEKTTKPKPRYPPTTVKGKKRRPRSVDDKKKSKPRSTEKKKKTKVNSKEEEKSFKEKNKPKDKIKNRKSKVKTTQATRESGSNSNEYDETDDDYKEEYSDDVEPSKPEENNANYYGSEPISRNKIASRSVWNDTVMSAVNKKLDKILDEHYSDSRQRNNRRNKKLKTKTSLKSGLKKSNKNKEKTKTSIEMKSRRMTQHTEISHNVTTVCGTTLTECPVTTDSSSIEDHYFTDKQGKIRKMKCTHKKLNAVLKIIKKHEKIRMSKYWKITRTTIFTTAPPTTASISTTTRGKYRTSIIYNTINYDWSDIAKNGPGSTLEKGWKRMDDFEKQVRLFERRRKGITGDPFEACPHNSPSPISWLPINNMRSSQISSISKNLEELTHSEIFHIMDQERLKSKNGTSPWMDTVEEEAQPRFYKMKINEFLQKHNLSKLEFREMFNVSSGTHYNDTHYKYTNAHGEYFILSNETLGQFTGHYFEICDRDEISANMNKSIKYIRGKQLDPKRKKKKRIRKPHISTPIYDSFDYPLLDANASSAWVRTDGKTDEIRLEAKKKRLRENKNLTRSDEIYRALGGPREYKKDYWPKDFPLNRSEMIYNEDDGFGSTSKERYDNMAKYFKEKYKRDDKYEREMLPLDMELMRQGKWRTTTNEPILLTSFLDRIHDYEMKNRQKEAEKEEKRQKKIMRQEKIREKNRAQLLRKEISKQNKTVHAAESKEYSRDYKDKNSFSEESYSRSEKLNSTKVRKTILSGTTQYKRKEANLRKKLQNLDDNREKRAQKERVRGVRKSLKLLKEKSRRLAAKERDKKKYGSQYSQMVREKYKPKKKKKRSSSSSSSSSHSRGRGRMREREGDFNRRYYASRSQRSGSKSKRWYYANKNGKRIRYRRQSSESSSRSSSSSESSQSRSKKERRNERRKRPERLRMKNRNKGKKEKKRKKKIRGKREITTGFTYYTTTIDPIFHESRSEYHSKVIVDSTNLIRRRKYLNAKYARLDRQERERVLRKKGKLGQNRTLAPNEDEKLWAQIEKYGYNATSQERNELWSRDGSNQTLTCSRESRYASKLRDHFIARGMTPRKNIHEPMSSFCYDSKDPRKTGEPFIDDSDYDYKKPKRGEYFERNDKDYQTPHRLHYDSYKEYADLEENLILDYKNRVVQFKNSPKIHYPPYRPSKEKTIPPFITKKRSRHIRPQDRRKCVFRPSTTNRIRQMSYILHKYKQMKDAWNRKENIDLIPSLDSDY